LLGRERDAGQAEVEFGPREKRERSRAGERVGFEWAGFLGWVFLPFSLLLIIFLFYF
jgi:hypothetical protein